MIDKESEIYTSTDISSAIGTIEKAFAFVEGGEAGRKVFENHIGVNLCIDIL